MSKTLRLASNLVLPIDVVTQKLAFFGKNGSGKTYAATKLAEMMILADAQIVALDPVGIWYGLRLGLDGKSPGLSIPVFGGLYGDVPLEPTAGALMADVIVDRGISAVIDVSQFEHDSEKTRFATDFANRLFYRKKAAPSALHIFLEEAQEFLPQNPQREENHMLHAFGRMWKIGRNYGFGGSLISLRPQEITTKARNLSEVVFAFQTNGTHERKAIADWVKEKGADVDVVEILPKLKVGMAHVWSPSWLEFSDTVQIEKKGTFNASATPKVGAIAIEARPLAPIDVEQLRKDMAATIEKAKSVDPKELRKRVSQLEAELRKAGKTAPAVATKTMEKLVVDQAAIQKAVTRAIAAERKRLAPVLAKLQRIATTVITLDLPGSVGALAQIVNEELATPGVLLAPVEHRLNPPSPVAPLSGSTPERRSGGHAGGDSRERPATTSNEAIDGLSKPQAKMLRALASFEALGIEDMARSHVAVFADQSPRSSGVDKNFSTLRTLGLIEYPSEARIRLTEAGRAAAGPVEAPASLQQLHDSWYAVLSEPQRKMLNRLIGEYPEPIARGELAEQTLQSETSSGYDKNLSTLRSLGLLDYPTKGQVAATELLFPEGLS